MRANARFASRDALVAALVTGLLTPVLLVLLCITVVGIAAVPFVGAALLQACLARRSRSRGSDAPSARRASAWDIRPSPCSWAALIVLALYLVPVFGFVVYKLLGLFGLGAVVYTLVLRARARRAAHAGRRRMPRPTQAAARDRTLPRDRGALKARRPALAPTEADERRGSGAPARRTRDPVAAGLPRAGFWIRMVALLLDALLVGF